MDHKVVVALPVYNEGAGLSQLLDKLTDIYPLFQDSLEIFVVNDGSTDHSELILKHYAQHYSYIKYVNHDDNKGLGEAMKTILEFAIHQLQDNDILITLDADNTHNPDIIANLVHKLKQDHLDVVIASRFITGGKEVGLTFARKAFSRGAKYFLKIFFYIPKINDYSCGFRAYSVGYVRKAFHLYNGELITSNGFDCMAEILARFSKIGVKADEYPLVLEYHLKQTASKLKVIKTIFGYLDLIRRVRRPISTMEKGIFYE